MIEIQASIISHSSILRKLNSGLRALPWEPAGSGSLKNRNQIKN
jgi:hypothetical protein